MNNRTFTEFTAQHITQEQVHHGFSVMKKKEINRLASTLHKVVLLTIPRRKEWDQIQRIRLDECVPC